MTAPDWPEHDMLESPAMSHVPPLVERRFDRPSRVIAWVAVLFLLASFAPHVWRVL